MPESARRGSARKVAMADGDDASRFEPCAVPSDTGARQSAAMRVGARVSLRRPRHLRADPLLDDHVLERGEERTWRSLGLQAKA
eukprot:5064293-Pleurochrysis_carterae.AAC.2